jgi:hypothetical protein
MKKTFKKNSEKLPESITADFSGGAYYPNGTGGMRRGCGQTINRA